jgi:hypothetical protein
VLKPHRKNKEMGFIERELERVAEALQTRTEDDQPDEFRRLRAVRQALSWALEPEGFKRPLDSISEDNQGVSEDCSQGTNPAAF